MARHWIVSQPVAPVDIRGVEWEVVYDNDLERGKKTCRNFPHPFFADDAKRWSDITGIPGLTHDTTLHGGGLQVMEPGGYLAPHLDYDHSPVVPAMRRALSVVAFAHPEWSEEWGGALVFCDPSGAVRERIVPYPGLVVAFECNELSYHGVEKVTGPVPRITLAKSFLVPAGRSRAVFLPNRMAS